ncbi:hypothetical protein SAMN04487897_1597 [Paenibacillus sp. yr247]|nr:hypothetical protein [Paenibacillus sp. yr247]SDP26349.1 hypothetical protein SAMN04487897_1597 [Paenibacillus sp. yr247]
MLVKEQLDLTKEMFIVTHLKRPSRKFFGTLRSNSSPVSRSV